MHITVYCPGCQSRYQVKPDLRGQLMRCPNANCLQVFEVREGGTDPGREAKTAPRPASPWPEEGGAVARRSGSVGDIVPIVPAEAIDPEPPQPENAVPDAGEVIPFLAAESAEPAPPAEGQSWTQPPPVRKRRIETPPAESGAYVLPLDEGPKRPARPAAPPGPSWQHAPPPVRRSAPKLREAAAPPPPVELPEEPAPVPETAAPVPPAAEPPTFWPGDVGAADPGHDEPTPAPTKRRRARWVMAAMLLLVVGAGGGVTWLVFHALAQTEEERYRLALEEFDQLNYPKAAALFQQLEKDFPDSPRQEEYKFLDEYSRTLQPAQEIDTRPGDTLAGLMRFLGNHEDDPYLRQRRQPAGQALAKIAGNLADEAGQALGASDLERAKRTLGEARQALAESKKYADAEEERVAGLVRDVDGRVRQAEVRRDTLAELRGLPASEEGILRADELLKKHGLEGDGEGKAIVEGLRKQVLARVRYVPAGVVPVTVPPPVPPGLAVVSLAAGKELGPGESAGSGVVFAVARGILYALREADGQFLWAARVGLDANALPVRVPRAASGELALVVSEDTHSLTARDVLKGGEVVWRLDLRAPCVGQPVLVDQQRALVATRDGRVQEIDARNGELLGWYATGARLAGGGTRQEGTSLAFFPADASNVYVLDANERKCVGILQTGHPPGSLRGEPMVAGLGVTEPAPAGQAGRRGYLILPQADGLDGLLLRAFALQTGRGVQAPPASAVVRVRGWSWFPPRCDGEKIALATDTGRFGLLGINQARNQDAPIFHFLPQGETAAGPAAEGLPHGRAEVVYAGDNDFWVLAEGELGRWQLAFDRRNGLQLTRRWRLPGLGYPIHAGQADEAGGTLFVVTRAADGPACLATAVDAANGRVRWQRRLGSVCQGDPLARDGGIVMQDREGGLFRFDPARDAPAEGREWRAAGLPLAPPAKGTVAPPPFLLPGPDGQTIFSIVSVPGGNALEVRQVKDGEVVSRTFPLRQPLAGTPAVGPGYLVLPLADGSLVWQALEGKAVRYGPSWRDKDAPRNAPGHVIHLAPDDFLTTDGLRGLFRWRWPMNVDRPQVEKSRTFPASVVAPPLVLPDSRVCVADAKHTVWVLKADDLEAVREVAVGGAVTAGPYRLGDFVACVVDGRRLVWFDPAGEAKHEYTAAEPIVGRPGLVNGAAIVADRGGRVTGLDPATGKEIGKGYRLPAGTSAAGTPVTFGDDRLFVPLTDGTVLLVPAKP